MTGILYGLGLGPGDPELVTVKALRILRDVPVVAYPAAVGTPSFARGIVAEYIDRGQTELPFEVPMVTDTHRLARAYDAAAAAIASYLDAGSDVAVLCQGDPFLYGSFMYVHARLARAYACEIVPGVSSVTASAARLRVPLVSHDETLGVLPASLPEAELDRRLGLSDAVAIVKLGRHFAKVRRLLDRHGLLDRALYIEHATLPQEHIRALAEIDPATVPYFSIVLVPGMAGGRK